MRIDLYILGDAPVAPALALIARASRAAGQRLLLVAQDPALLDMLDTALWEQLPDAFLAHGRAGQPHAERQPVLLATDCGARGDIAYLALADGQWREEAFGFERVFLLVDEAALPAARRCWVMLDGMEGVERHFWKRVDGRWVEGP